MSVAVPVMAGVITPNVPVPVTAISPPAVSTLNKDCVVSQLLQRVCKFDKLKCGKKIFNAPKAT